MFLREKKSGDRVYLQLVESRWEEGRPKQRVLATLGRLDKLKESSELDGLARSAARLSEQVLLIEAHERGDALAWRLGASVLGWLNVCGRPRAVKT